MTGEEEMRRDEEEREERVRKGKANTIHVTVERKEQNEIIVLFTPHHLQQHNKAQWKQAMNLPQLKFSQAS